MIMFAASTHNSIGRMFIGAMMPALLTVLLMITYVIISCKMNPKKAPITVADTDNQNKPLGQKLSIARDGFLAMLLIVAVLGSIISGIATPTESGAIGVVGAVILSIVFKRFKVKMFLEVGLQTSLLVSVAMWIIFGASVFSNFHLLMGVQSMVSDFTTNLDLPPIMIIIMFQVIMLLLGFVIDEFIIVLMCAPLFTPIAVSMGYDPIWFGIIIVLVTHMADIYRSVTPFVLINLTVLITCMIFPQIVLWLPTMILG